MPTDQRSGLCHGPDCQAKITDGSGSDDFCSQACQARWQAALVGVPADSALLAETPAASPTWTPTVTPSLPPSIQEGDQLVVLMDNRTGTFTPAPPKMTVRLVETGEVLFTGPVELWPEVGEAATQSPTVDLGSGAFGDGCGSVADEADSELITLCACPGFQLWYEGEHEDVCRCGHPDGEHQLGECTGEVEVSYG